MRNGKLEELCDQEGLDLSNMDDMGLVVMDSVHPGICMNPGCDYTIQVEPDQGEGYCEECGTNSVASLGRLMGII